MSATSSPPLSNEALAIRERLGLTPHPEGGYYRETWRGALVLRDLPHGAARAAHTAIYFLVPTGSFSALHRVKSDEVWHFYDGDPLELTLIRDEEDGSSSVETYVLGRELERGQRPQLVVPAGVWQAASPFVLDSTPPAPSGASIRGFTLCGCTVAPGFDFADFEMPPRDELLARYPDHHEVVARLTRDVA